MTMLELLPLLGHAGYGFVVGAILGSFINALSYRLPRGISMVTPRSSCPSCKMALGIRDLVPILSWLISKGRCNHCGAPYGKRYLVIELFMAASCALLYVLFWEYWFILPVVLGLAAVVTFTVIYMERTALK